MTLRVYIYTSKRSGGVKKKTNEYKYNIIKSQSELHNKAVNGKNVKKEDKKTVGSINKLEVKMILFFIRLGVRG